MYYYKFYFAKFMFIFLKISLDPYLIEIKEDTHLF